MWLTCLPMGDHHNQTTVIGPSVLARQRVTKERTNEQNYRKFLNNIYGLEHLSKIWGTTFWPSGQGCQKHVNFFKVTYLEAELKLKMTESAFLDISNFSYANILLTSLAMHLVKMLFLRFLKEGLVTELLRKTCKGDMFIIGFKDTWYLYLRK